MNSVNFIYTLLVTFAWVFLSDLVVHSPLTFLQTEGNDGDCIERKTQLTVLKSRYESSSGVSARNVFTQNDMTQPGNILEL